MTISKKSALVLRVLLILCMTVILISGLVFAEQEEGWPIRLSGDDRYETAAAIALYAYETADTVIVARGDLPFDALGGSVLAGVLEAPILLTRTGELPAATIEAIDDLGAGKAIILGGEKAVSADVEKGLEDEGLDIERIYGPDRYATAAEIAGEVEEHLGEAFGDAAFLVNGTAVADSLAIGPYAAASGNPILLIDKDSVPAVTDEAIGELALSELTAIGGTDVISDALVDDYNAGRVAGEDRYKTSVAVAEEYFEDVNTIIFSAGLDQNLIDAVSGGYLGGMLEVPIIYSGSEELGMVSEYFNSIITEETMSYILGGKQAVSEAVEAQIFKAMALLGVADMIFDEAGVYGPAVGAVAIDDDVTVKADEVTLRNLEVKGDLTVAETARGAAIINLTVEGNFLNNGPNTSQEGLLVKGEITARSESPALAGFQFLPLGVRPPCNIFQLDYRPAG